MSISGIICLSKLFVSESRPLLQRGLKVFHNDYSYPLLGRVPHMKTRWSSWKENSQKPAACQRAATGVSHSHTVYTQPLAFKNTNIKYFYQSLASAASNPDGQSSAVALNICLSLQISRFQFPLQPQLSYRSRKNNRFFCLREWK